MSAPHFETSDRRQLTWWVLGISLATLAWFLAYSQLSTLAEWLVGLLGQSRQTHFGEAVHFFLYDTPKVLFLLTGIVFVMGVIQTFFSPERTRTVLSGRQIDTLDCAISSGRLAYQGNRRQGLALHPGRPQGPELFRFPANRF